MIKKIVFGTLIIMIGFFTTLILSPNSTRWILNQYLASDKLKVECLNYSITSITRIAITEACLNSPSFDIAINSASFDLSLEQLFIDIVTLKLKETESQVSDEPFTIPMIVIPSYLPKIAINSVSLVTPKISDPIIFKVTQLTANSFAISDDWAAIINIKDNNINIQLDWTLSSVRSFLPSSFISIVGQHQWDSPIRSQAILNESSITSNHLFTLDFTHQIEGCDLDLTMGGSAQVNADLSNQQATIDLSQLAVLLNLQRCQPLQNIPSEMQPGTITVSFPDTIVASQDILNTTQIDLSLIEPFATEITLSEVNLMRSGEFDSLVSASIIDGESGSFRSSGEISLSNGKPFVNLPLSELRITSYSDNNVDLKDIMANFSLTYADKMNLQGKGSIQTVNTGITSLQELKSTFSVHGNDFNNLNIAINSHLNKAQFSEYSLAKIQQDFQFTLHDLTHLSGEGKSLIKQLKSASVSLTDTSIDHRLKGNIADNILTSQHTALVNKKLSVVAKQSQQNINISIAPQPVTSINSIVKQWIPELSFFNGELSTHIDYDLSLNTGTGRLLLDDLSVLRSDMIIIDISMDAPFELDSAGLQLDTSKLTINEVYNGVKLTAVTANVAATNSLFSASNITATLFDGNLSVERIWLDTRDQTIDLVVKGMNLQKILNLQEKAGINAGGIEISGLISGRVPLTIKDMQPSINNGLLSNTGLGTLRINGNEAFQALKQQSPKIGNNLALLENFNFDSLESSLNMTTTGQTYLDIALKGNNPDKKQALNFNYTHDQDMFTLFKALRIADDFKEKIEKRLSKIH
jgi:hypothetical protein